MRLARGLARQWPEFQWLRRAAPCAGAEGRSVAELPRAAKRARSQVPGRGYRRAGEPRTCWSAMISSSCSAIERTRPCVPNRRADACECDARGRWVGLTSEIDPIRCSALSAGSASHSSTLILIRSGTENTAAPAGPNEADAGLAAATASSAALPVASVGISTARLVSVFPRRNGGG